MVYRLALSIDFYRYSRLYAFLWPAVVRHWNVFSWLWSNILTRKKMDSLFGQKYRNIDSRLNVKSTAANVARVLLKAFVMWTQWRTVANLCGTSESMDLCVLSIPRIMFYRIMFLTNKRDSGYVSTNRIECPFITFLRDEDLIDAHFDMCTQYGPGVHNYYFFFYFRTS